MPTDTQELALVTAEAPIALMKRADIPNIFASFESQIAPLSKIANDLAITSADQTAEIAIARTTRLSLKKLRVAVENRRKELKEGILEEGRKIDGAANKLKELIEPLEEKLAAQEKIAERLEAERKLKLAEERAEALKPFGIDPTFYALAEMPEESWEQLLENSRVAFEAKKVEAARLEQERIAAENARLKREAEEAAERQRVKAENERLKKEAEERERLAEIERQRAAKEKAEAESALKAEREAAEKETARLKKLADDAESYRVAQEARAAREKQEAEERAASELRAQQEAAAAKEKAARIKANKEKAALEAEHAAKLVEQQRKADEEAKKEKAEHDAAIAEVNRKAEEASRAAFVAQRKEEERRARELQAQRDAEAAALEAAKAPDRDKLTVYADALLAVPLPALNTEAGNLCLQRVEREVKALAEFILKKAVSM